MFEDAEPRVAATEREAAVDALIGDHDHLARLDLADELCTDDVQRTGFRGQAPAVRDLAQNQRAHAQRVTHADQLGPGHGDDRKGAFDPAQRIFHPVGDVLLQRPRHQVDDAFAVRRALEDRAAFDQFPAQGIGIGDVAVMGQRRAAHGELTEERLHVADRGGPFRPGGRVAHMPDGQGPGQGFHHVLRGEVVADIAEPAGRVEAVVGMMADDTAGLLSTVLQRVQAKRDEVRGIGDADHAEDAALFMQLVIVPRAAGQILRVIRRMGGGESVVGQGELRILSHPCPPLMTSAPRCHERITNQCPGTSNRDRPAAALPV